MKVDVLYFAWIRERIGEPRERTTQAKVERAVSGAVSLPVPAPRSRTSRAPSGSSQSMASGG